MIKSRWKILQSLLLSKIYSVSRKYLILMHALNKTIGHVVYSCGFLPKKPLLLSHISTLFDMRLASATVSTDC